MNSVGQGIDRVDGRLKVTGAATFSAEHPLARLAYAVMVQSTIAKGRITAIDVAPVRAMKGVLAVMTYQNAPHMQLGAKPPPPGQPPPPKLTLLQDARIQYNGQPVAVVVAGTLEHAQDAARRLQCRYAQEKAVLDFQAAKKDAREAPSQPERPATVRRGDADAEFDRAPVRFDAVYTTPLENHNPMEPHATIAAWSGDHLTVYDATQNITGVRKTVAGAFGMPPERVRVVCPFVGGGFGCKGQTWSHVVLAAMAARLAGVPVKLAIERTQMFGPVGARPMTEQHLRLGAQRDGQLLAVINDTVSSTSFVDDFAEPSTAPARKGYATRSLRTSQCLATLNLGVPTYMRAPGESSGSFALESAIDELALMLGMDPVALRLLNYAGHDPESGQPWSQNALRECLRIGAERFGWARRTARPGSMHDGRSLVGWGVAMAAYPANRKEAKARAIINPDGSAIVRSGSHDLGTGTYTVMTQVAADALGLPVERVRFELGDTDFPEAPVSGGSQTVASVGPAVRQAAMAARAKLVGMALADAQSPLHGAPAAEVEAGQGWLFLRAHPEQRDAFTTLIARHGGKAIEADAEAKPGEEKERYAMRSFGAVFTEVRVDPDLYTLRVPRIVAVYDVGTLLNKKTARSQLIGGIVWGLGMGLMEKTEMDWRTGRTVSGNLADYHVPVNADVGSIDVQTLDVPDYHCNELGARGIGEIGITGVAAALANAVYHATGKRIRDLPITVDKLLA